MALTKDQKLILRLLDTCKDLIAILDIFFEYSDDPDSFLLRRKLSIMKKKLPRVASDIKSLTAKRDTATLTLKDFVEEVEEEL